MLLKFSDLLIYEWIGLDPESRLGGAIHFFVYDTIKIFLLLAVMIFVIGIIRTWLPERKLRAWMGSGGIWGNFVAALFGDITPFCSCSSIPIFISLLKAGVPLGVTFSFLITSPIINEYLVILMAGEFGIPITVLLDQIAELRRDMERIADRFVRLIADEIFDAEYQVMLYEFKAGLNDYLANHPVPEDRDTLAELIAWNRAHADQAMPHFGQEIFLDS